jgi:hypothetical protein
MRLISSENGGVFPNAPVITYDPGKKFGAFFFGYENRWTRRIWVGLRANSVDDPHFDEMRTDASL